MPPDFETLFETHSARIYAYLWRLMRDPVDAEDCLQETFLRAYRAYGRVNGHTNPTAWLYRIATNTARTHLKQRTRSAARTADLDPDLTAGGFGADERLAQRETLQAVERAVDALPARQRSALILRKYQGLSYSEVALALDCNEAAARANVYQALQRLRRELATAETRGRK